MNFGTAQVTLGDAEIAHATAVGDAGIALTNHLNQDDTVLASANGAAGQAWTSTSTAAETAETADGVTADQARVASLGTSAIAYQDDLAAADTAWTTASAGAGAEWQSAGAGVKAAQWQTAAGASGATPETLFYAAHSTARQSWLADNTDDYIAHATARSASEGAKRVDIVTAAADAANQRAAAEGTYSNSGAARDAAQENAQAQKSAAFDNTLTGHFNGDASAVAQADKSRLVAIAQAEKVFAISSAGAMKQYQIDVASGVSGAVHTRDVGQADAQLQLATSLADADLAWTQTTAAADETLAYQYADDVRNLRKDLAALARDRKLGESSDWSVLDAALTSADNDEETAGAAAGADQTAADGSADAEFLSSQYDDAVPVTQAFATQLGSPWAQFRADLAGARQTWFSGDPNNPNNPGQREEYAALGSDTGAFQNSLAGSMANIRDALAQALRGAETSFTGTEAGAHLLWTQRSKKGSELFNLTCRTACWCTATARCRISSIC